ncbi:FimV/HubP family polar landmark protein [Noviherbaspirillum saxi]|uniref:LysM peptidoglycan-binding domain-containing protein n=1 Tax=Noviherbaspirillum saxi TaxID=2320863 RepID=A0A3A3FRL9_9BURK|nr:FimV/HubP family polar landmark protein [Noviherbaspirillum saxi]RJF98862.1 LysM peptidoglycan-binding domain-containing protein [Noviherbaspirillum saxi]
MHSNKRPSGLFTLKTLSAAVATALLFSNAYAAGLGKLTVLSSLGQPLRAEIELTSVSRDELGSLAAKLASAEAFRQAGIDYTPALASLRFAVEQRGERQVIRLTSAQPLNEPFVDMLLELSGPNGRLVREYTFLLDPADLRTTQSAQVAPARVAIPDSSVSRAPQSTRSSQSVTQSSPAPRNVPQAEAPSRAERPVAPPPVGSVQDTASGDYKVRNGDTLAKIATQVKSGGVSLDQMLVALHQANPDAFVGQNMNRLKAGQILSVPSAEVARGVSNAEARNIVVAQAADFQNYRSKLAGQVASSAPQKSTENRQSAGGKITAKVEERATPASESKDKLTLSNAAPTATANADKAAGTASAEDRIAKEKAIADANARVKELEKNVSELQKILEVKNKNLADQQKQADATKVEAKPATPAPAASTPSQAAAPAAPASATAAPSTEGTAVVAATPAASATPPAPAAEKPAEPTAEKPTAPVVAKPKPVAPPPPPPEPSFLESLTENPMALPGLGALLVALGALGIYRARRQKQDKQFEDSIITDSSLKANSLFGSTGGQSVDTNNSVFNSSFSPSASQLDSNEVDPVAEADVYIAYGRDAQAEEILKEALRTQPERHAVRVKLLEIYSNRKDLRAFEVLATELYGLTKGEGDEWAQAVALGVGIDPNNPLYASGKDGKAGSDDQSAGGLVAPTQPLDEQGLATLLSTTQSDANTLDTINSLETDTSYFSNTALASDTQLDATPAPAAEVAPATANDLDFEPMGEAELEKVTSKATTSNELDFDLDGLNMPEMAVPNTIPRPIAMEPPAALASIDFDFLDTPAAESKEEAKPESLDDFSVNLTTEAPLQPEPVDIPEIKDLEFSLDDAISSTDAPIEPQVQNIETAAAERPSLEIDIPELEDIPAIPEAKAESAPNDPLDFDLSDISLELNPVEPAATTDTDFDVSLESLGEAPSLEGAGDESGFISAEMATKLDLAIAYQEIGDKEGARELLDEVLKGGTPEQSEKAKSLLLELA